MQPRTIQRIAARALQESSLLRVGRQRIAARALEEREGGLHPLAHQGEWIHLEANDMDNTPMDGPPMGGGGAGGGGYGGYSGGPGIPRHHSNFRRN